VWSTVGRVCLLEPLALRMCDGERTDGRRKVRGCRAEGRRRNLRSFPGVWAVCVVVKISLKQQLQRVVLQGLGQRVIGHGKAEWTGRTRVDAGLRRAKLSRSGRTRGYSRRTCLQIVHCGQLHDYSRAQPLPRPLPPAPSITPCLPAETTPRASLSLPGRLVVLEVATVEPPLYHTDKLVTGPLAQSISALDFFP